MDSDAFRSNGYPDASGLLAYGNALDTRRALWFIPSGTPDDLLAVENGCAVRQGAYPFDGRGWEAVHAFFRAFKSVFVAAPRDSVTMEIAREIQAHCPDVPVIVPKDGAFRNAKSLRETLETGGRKAIDHLLLGAEELPAQGLLDLADIKLMKMPSFRTGFTDLDKTIGGFYLGELSVWTGKRGGGKSTILGQTLLDAVEQGIAVCAYSGELSAWRFKDWAARQAAGPENVIPHLEPSGKTSFDIPDSVRRKIDKWWRGLFFLYDNEIPGASGEDSIIRTFEYADRKYGCMVYLVDNLMSTRFNGAENNRENFYQAQSSFTGRLVEFAKKHGVHVHLVAHPRKTPGAVVKDADDVSGTGDITNRADNVFAMSRLSDEDAAKEGCSTMLHILKNRDFGETGYIKLDFDERSKRFYKKCQLGAHRKYGWDK